MNASDLATFLHLANSGSLSGTARLTHAPKSSVSRALARLEADAGVPLFDRSTRHFRLTEAGAALRPYAIRVVHDLEEARAMLEGMAGEPRGLLRINTTPAFAQQLIAPMLVPLMCEFPQLCVELQTSSRQIDLALEGADVAIRVGTLADSSLVARRLPSIETWLVASPDYVALHDMPATLADLVGHKMVTWEPMARWTMISGGVERVLEPAGHIVVADATSRRVVIEAGGGIGSLPAYLAAPSVASGRMVRILPAWKLPTVEVHAIYPSHRSMSAKLRAFIDAWAKHLSAVLPPLETN